MENTFLQISEYSLSVPWYAKQLLLSGFIGLIIGVEREFKGKPASLRTFAAICVGSCLYAALSLEAAGGVGQASYDMTRIAAQIVTGIGFIGGGVIFKTSDRIEGITTAALIWLTAGLGMGCGFNRTDLVIWALGIGAFMHVIIFLMYQIIYFKRDREREAAMTESTLH